LAPSVVTKDGTAVEHYVYDANGNRASATVNGTTVAGTYDARDRMESCGDATYTYLASGELATKTVPGTGASTYDYDELGSLVHLELPNGDDVDYNVDGLGRRVTRKLNGTVTNRFQYGTGLQPMAELDAAGNTVSTFVYASRGNVPDYMTKGGVHYRFVTDQVGSVRMVVNTSTGVVAQRIDYDSFGNIMSDTDPVSSRSGLPAVSMTGTLVLSGSALATMTWETGRFTAKDPILFEGGDTNLYAYVGSDPIDRIDPRGLDWIEDLNDSVGGFVDGLTTIPFTGISLMEELRDHMVGIALGLPRPSPTRDHTDLRLSCVRRIPNVCSSDTILSV